MKYLSTRRKTEPQTFTECLLQGLALDGGLFVPERFPHYDLSNGNLNGVSPDASLATFAARVLQPFVDGSSLETTLTKICEAAFNFETPLKFLKKSDGTAVLELFHGPTAAFKDVAARFLATCIAEIGNPATVLVATSGDTGGAVAAAFNGKPGVQTVILYPKGKISARQEKQLTCWGTSVKAFALKGTFDDCQRVVKDALSDKGLNLKLHFISANSISIGRLLPQTAYHAHASLQYQKHFGKKPTLIIPTGNLGNATAAMWAKRAGFPIGKIILATNANPTIFDYFTNGKFEPGQTVSTLANAMDVSNPSNFERMIALYPNIQFLKDDVNAISISDHEISDLIKRGEKDYGEIFCPHTATALVAKEKLQIENALIIATAHPAKFESIVEPLIGKSVAVPPALAAVLGRPSVSIDIEPNLDALRTQL